MREKKDCRSFTKKLRQQKKREVILITQQLWFQQDRAFQCGIL